MFVLDAIAILVLLAAVFGLINHHLLRLPFTIGMLLAGLAASAGVLAVDRLWPALQLAAAVRGAVLEVDFAATVLNGMLSVLLFAGALHTDLSLLRSRLGPILLLATVGTLVATAVAGSFAWLAFGWCGVAVAPMFCFVFGALISPTDPIAVLGIMKAAGAPRELEIKVVGESMFNDGVGVVLFTVLLGAAVGQDAVEAGSLAALVGREVLGGCLLGGVFGWLGDRALRSLDEANLEILITFAVVLGIGLLGDRLHVSAPLAAVVAGLWIGNRGRARSMTEHTEQALDTVWMFVDEALNAVLFLLIGIEVLAIDYEQAPYLWAAALLVPLVLVARFVAVVVPLRLVRDRAQLGRGAVRVLTWGGIKGGISIALAMKTPEFPGRNAVLTATYAIVVFSVVVQGLTVGPLVRRLRRE